METTPVTPREILLLPMRPNDAGALTVGGYLQSLLRALWNDGECFDGKRPFGNSCWEHELYEAIVSGGASTGTVDEDGSVIEEGNAGQLVFDAIDALFPEPWAQAEAARIAGAALRARADDIDPVGDNP